MTRIHVFPCTYMYTISSALISGLYVRFFPFLFTSSPRASGSTVLRAPELFSCLATSYLHWLVDMVSFGLPRMQAQEQTAGM
jgi:hypothetical protein